MNQPESVPASSIVPGDVICLPGYGTAPLVAFRVWNVDQQADTGAAFQGVRCIHLHCTDDDGEAFNAWRAPHEPVVRLYSKALRTMPKIEGTNLAAVEQRLRDFVYGGGENANDVRWLCDRVRELDAALAREQRGGMDASAKPALEDK